jgi:phosphoketolase
VLDNPQLVTAVVIGDGEAETGPLAASWHSHNFLNPASDGAVLPILHLNGYKIANPTVLARMPEAQLEQLLRGYGHEPYFVTVQPRRRRTGTSPPCWMHVWLTSRSSRKPTAAARTRQARRVQGACAGR